MSVGVVYYPGSNCEQDAVHAARLVGLEAGTVWHRDTDLSRYEALIIAGGFSYGDHLRAGALARFSPVMGAMERYVADGGMVLGICNGFQVLVEAGLLPGALMPNAGLKFRCQDLLMRVERNDLPYTRACAEGQVLRLNMAHYEGCFYVDELTAQRLEKNGQIAMRFCGPRGERASRFNPNGSVNDIAAVSDESGRVMGLMPHPERCMEPALGSDDGRYIFNSLREAIVARRSISDEQPLASAAGTGQASLAQQTQQVLQGEPEVALDV